ncbi:MAG: hypothetical protein EXS30_00270 [Pedosphaera sp.]|nr:hypothetical protein [Pedosphaera sp.]
MNLNEAQKKKVEEWIAEGLKLSDIQKRLDSELGVRMTYMEVRFLLDDLQLVPKDQPAPQADKQIVSTTSSSASGAESKSPPQPLSESPPAPGEETLPIGSKVSLKVDAVTAPGTLVSGSVTFSDGQIAAWYLDQMGRLGLSPKQTGYRPLPADVEDFQVELQNELQKLGF